MPKQWNKLYLIFLASVFFWEADKFCRLQNLQLWKSKSSRFVNFIGFLYNAVTLSVFELDKCSLHVNGVAFDKYFNGDPKHHKILLVVGIQV